MQIKKSNNKHVGAGLVSAQNYARYTQRGITLISLIITIIILLILAGVTINLLIGENGIFRLAETATEKQKIATIKESVQLDILEFSAKKTAVGEKLTKEQALIEMEKKGTFEEIDLKESTGIKEGYVITLGYDKSGNVIITDIQKDVGVRLTIKQEPTGYTNEVITVTIGLSTNQETINTIEVPEGMTKTEDGTYTIERNGTYKIKAKLSSGASLEKEIIIATIDKLPPKEFTPDVTVDNGIIKITENGEDSEATEESVQSGIDYYEYYVKNAGNEETKYETNEIEGLSTGKYKIYLIAYDKAGNHTKSIEVDAEVEEWIKIYTEEDLRNIANDLTKNYILMNDIVLTEDWTAIGDSTKQFRGKLDGAGYKISGLNINKIAGYQGLFGLIYEGGKVSNLKLEGNVIGGTSIGLLAGYNCGTIENVKVKGTVEGQGNSTINSIGGLVGYNYDFGIIEKCYSEVEVKSSLEYSVSNVGGLVGQSHGTIRQSTSSGNVTGSINVGGLVGSNMGTIINTYTISKVMGSSDIGGLVGLNRGTITNSYWTHDKSGVETSAGGTELTLEQMQTQASYEGWDFTNTWKMGASGFPELVFDFGKVSK